MFGMTWMLALKLRSHFFVEEHVGRSDMTCRLNQTQERKQQRFSYLTRLTLLFFFLDFFLGGLSSSESLSDDDDDGFCALNCFSASSSR